ERTVEDQPSADDVEPLSEGCIAAARSVDRTLRGQRHAAVGRDANTAGQHDIEPIADEGEALAEIEHEIDRQRQLERRGLRRTRLTATNHDVFAQRSRAGTAKLEESLVADKLTFEAHAPVDEVEVSLAAQHQTRVRTVEQAQVVSAPAQRGLRGLAVVARQRAAGLEAAIATLERKSIEDQPTVDESRPQHTVVDRHPILWGANT